MTLFVDTSYLIAMANRSDQWAAAARSVQSRVSGEALITTDSVLSEFLAFFGERGTLARTNSAATVREVLLDPGVTVRHLSHADFLGGLALYEARPDKGYSLVDCVSMNVMRELGLAEALTSDRHFEQEGFAILLR